MSERAKSGQSTDEAPRLPYAETVAATPVAGSEGAAPPDEGEPEAEGDRYERLERLGEGGMGDVRLCHDAVTGRDVAMKAMRNVHVGRTDLDARFLREARVQARMEHPSIVPVYDLGIAGGRPFFTMKRVRGATLTEILGRLRNRDREAVQTYSLHKLLAAFATVCLTVDFAHAQGVIHRDLKPDNIMLGTFGELYVLDWGIARLAAGDPGRSSVPDDGSLQTRAGAVFGTLGYMAPEQIEPKLGGTDERSDVYALGAILFEILTLEPLHPLGDAQKMVASTLLWEPRSPSARAPARRIPPELDAICMKATAREAGDRFPSARALNAALERFREKDRDVERREAGARDHAARASAAAAIARVERDPKAPKRVECLREAASALAFDPSNESALSSLREMLASPPSSLPPEVEQELQRATQTLATRRGRIATLLQLSWFAYLPLVFVVGMRDWSLYALVSSLFAVTSLLTYHFSKRPSVDGRMPWYTQVLVAAAMSSLSVAWSPLILVPPIAVLLAVAWIVVPRRKGWPVTEVLLACSVVLVPTVLADWKIIPPFFAFDGATLLLLPRMVALPETPTLLVAGATHVLIILSVAGIMIVLRSSLDRTQRRLRLQAWQLRQLAAPKPAAANRASLFDPLTRSEGTLPIASTANTTGGGRKGLDEPLAIAPTAERYRRDPEEPSASAPACEDLRIGREVTMVSAPPEHADELVRQARLVARLEHPSIPPTYDIGEDAAGNAFVTTRRVRGTTLSELLRRDVLTSRFRLIEVFVAACRAVDYAHASGVVHTQLSSRSVLVGDYGDVYVDGWATARALGDLDLRAGEEALRRDVAALGEILAEILHQTDAETAPEKSESPSVSSILALVPLELDVICARATGLEESGAYRTAGELQGAVERYVEGERDFGRRKVRAAEHAKVALTEAERAFAGTDTEARMLAMREVSQALALDPSNARATGVLMRLLTVPPADLPPEAEEEMALAAHDERRLAARTAAILYGLALFYLPVTLLQGVESLASAAIVPCAIVVAIVAFVLAARSKDPHHEPVSTVICSMLAACVAGTAGGSLMLVPTIVLGNMSGFLLQAMLRRRAVVVVLACLAVVFPLGLQLAHLIPPSYVAHDGGVLVLVPHLTKFTATTPLILAAVQVSFIVSACVFYRRFRDLFQRAQERVYVNAWQLRQLVPAEAHAAMSLRPSPPTDKALFS